MKKILLILALPIASFSQELNRQMIASQGKSFETPSGFYVSQSVGQSSVIGRGNDMDIDLLQGFQQPFFNRFNIAVDPGINVMLYPIPTENVLTIYFNKYSESNANILIFDVVGKLILEQKLTIIENTASLDLSQYAAGAYLIQLKGKNLSYQTQIIKK